MPDKNILSLLLTVLMVIMACTSQAQAQKEPSSICVILITIDTLRADHLGCYGYKSIRTPNIDALAQAGTLFRRAFTPVPVTLPSHVSIFTGLYPYHHGVLDNGSFILQPQAITLAEIFKEHGFKTGAIIGAYVLDSMFGLDQGFDYYNDHLTGQGQQSMAVHFNERNAAEVTKLAKAWIKEQGHYPFFLWLHYFDPHAAYKAPPPFAKPYSRCPYDGEIAYTDHCLGLLFQTLKRQKLFKNSLIIITADHGEGLGEHGESTHGNFLYDATLRIPMIFKLRLSSGQVRQVDSLVRTIDLFPTILDLAGLSDYIPKKIDGLSLLPLIRGAKKEVERSLFCETYYPLFHYGWSPEHGLRTGHWKYIEAPKPELYDLTVDPGEQHNLFRPQHPMVLKLRSKLMAGEGEKASVLPVQLGREAVERLQSLGYIQSFTSGPPREPSNPVADVKDKVKTLRQMEEGIAYMSQANYQQALTCFSAIVHSDPGNISALFYQACLYQKLHQDQAAIAAFEKILDFDPTHMDIHNHLGIIYHQMNDPNQAIREFMSEIKIHPDYAEARYNLAVDYLKQGKIQKALDAATYTLKLDQNYADAYNLLGKIWIKKRDLARAEENFQKAISVCPEHEEAYNNLGVLHMGQKEYTQAIKELTTARKLNPHHAGILINLARAYLHQKRYNMAEECLHEALQQAESERGHLLLAQLYAEQGLWPKARQEWEDTIRLNPKNVESYHKLGALCYQQGKMAEAIKTWEKIFQFEPNCARAHLQIGSAKFQQGDISAAISEWKSALKIEPKNFEALSNLGSVYIQRGEFEKAKKSWQKALVLQPQNPDLHFNLGLIFLKQGMIAKGKAELEKVLEIKPHYPRAKELLRKAGEITGTGH